MKRANRRNDGRQRVSGGSAGPALLTIAAMLLVAPFVQAQLHSMPGSKTEAPVLCTGCQGNNYYGQPNNGLKTYPYSSPIRRFVGRYVDSTSTASFQGALGFRTARARYIRTAPQQRGTAPPRVYIVIGNGILGYALDRFFTQMLPAGMQPVTAIKTGKPIQGVGRKPPEDLLVGNGFFYPEATSSPKWYIPTQDKQDPIGGGAPFDFDDRGHLYGAYTFMGWGIVKDDGRTDGFHFPRLVQMSSDPDATGPITRKDTSDVSPESIVALKVGTAYYAVTATQNDREAVWNVTDPASPRLLRTRTSLAFGIRRFDRNDARKHIAVITGKKSLRIYDYSAFVGSDNPVPLYENTSVFTDVSYDESGNLWAAERENRIWKLTPGARGYTATVYIPHLGRFDHLAMHVAAGYVFVQGRDRTSGVAFDARLLKIEPGMLRNIDLDGFFRKYYHSSPINYANPAANNSPEVMGDVQIVKSGGKTYLMYSTVGLGDVFEIDGGG